MRRHRDLGPNTRLIGEPRSRQTLAPPALILDIDAFEHNVKSWRGFAGAPEYLENR
jgi:hypothetical protein